MQKIQRFALIPVLLLLVGGLAATLARADDTSPTLPAHVAFEPNMGQTGDEALYLGRAPGLRLLLTSSGVSVLPVDAVVDTPTTTLSFVGGHPEPVLQPTDPLPGRVHYLSGSQPDAWIAHVPTYAGVVYREIYPGIEAAYLALDSGFALRFRLSPGSAPEDILLQWNAAEDLQMTEHGDLLVRASGADLELRRPRMVQWVEGSAVRIDGAFATGKDGSLGFVADAYDGELPLEIEIGWVPATAPSIDAAAGVALAIDHAGCVVVAGQSGPGGPDRSAAARTDPWPVHRADAFVMRLGPDGTTPLSTTYFGGTADDAPLALATAADGDLVIAGRTDSADFPVTHERGTDTGENSDAFVARLAEDGASWVYSIVLGGSGNDRVASVALDASSNAWIVGTTDSPDFPVDSEAVQPEIAGGSDLFVARVSRDGSERLHTGFLGGIENDTAADVAILADGDLLLAGSTRSAQFSTGASISGVVSGGEGDSNGFVLRLRADDGVPETVTLLGGSSDDAITAIAPTPDGGFVAVGWTDSTDLPLTANALQGVAGGVRDGFLVRFTAEDAIEETTYFGGGGDDRAIDVALDTRGVLWVAGTTDSDRLPGSQGRSRPGAMDGFLAKLEGAEPRIVRTTFVGGTADDHVDRLTLDLSETPVVSGRTALRGASTLLSVESSPERGDPFVMRAPGGTNFAAGCPGTVNFDNDSGNLAWGTATNWDGDVLPTSTDDVCIDGYAVTFALTQEVLSLTTASAGSLSVSSGTLTLSGASQIDGTLALSGGTITGVGDLTVNGAMTWTSGTLSGTGELNPQGGLSISGASPKFLSRTLNNTATTTVTATNNSFYLSTGGTFHNMAGGTFDSQNDLFLNFGGGSPSFINEGTFVKSAGTGTSQLQGSIAFANDGIVDVQTGTFQLVRGATHSGSFDFTGATLRFGGGTHDLSAAETLTGTDLTVASGTVNVPGGLDVSGTTTVSGATLNLTGSITDIGTIALTSGTLNLSNTEGLVTQPVFDMTGGTLTGTSDLTVTGTMTWTSGTISGTGELNPQGGLSISGASPKFLSRTLNNTATTTATPTNNSFYLSTGGTFHNMAGGTFDSQNDLFLNFGGGSPSFINEGTFVKSAGTGTSQLQGSIAFANDGIVDVQTGTFQLVRGATHGGSFDFTGATLRFAGGTQDLSAAQTLTGTDLTVASGTVNVPGGLDVSGTTTVSGATLNLTGSITDIGTIALTSGTLNLSNTEGLVTQPVFDMTGGTLTGTSDLTVTGTMTWTSGTISGTGELNPQGGLSISGASPKFLSRTLNNTATTTATPTNNSFYLSTGGTFHNMAGGTFDSQNDLFLNFGGGSPSFINEGTFVKSAGTGTSQLQGSIAFANDGIVDVQTGTFQLVRGATHGGSFDFTGATLRFAGGTQDLSAAQTLTGTDLTVASGTVNVPGGLDVSGTTTVSGATLNLTGSITDIGTIALTSGTLNLSNTEGLVTQPVFDMTGGTLTGTSDLTVTGTMTWTSGTISGTGELNPQGGLSISGASPKFLSRTLNNTATTTATPTNNSFYLSTGGTFHNMAGGTFDSQNDLFLNFGGGSPSFINEGTFVKSAGTGTSQLQGSIAFANDGIVDVQTGTLRLNRGATHGGSFDFTGATLRFNGGTHDLSAAQTLTGTNLTVASGTVNVPGGLDVSGTTTVSSATLNLTGSIANIGTIALTNGTLNLSNVEGLVTQSTFNMTSGTLTGSSDFAVTGAMTWTGGTLSGTGSVNPLGGLSISSASTKWLARTLNNTATTVATWTNNSLFLTTGGTFHNMAGGTFDSQSDVYFNFGGGSPSFINEGTFVKSAGAGTTRFANSITFTNSGAVQTLSGTLHTGNLFTQTAGSTTLNGGALTCGATLPLDGGLLTGIGTVTTPSVSSSATVAPGVASIGVLDITGAYTQSSTGTFQVELGGVGCPDSDRLDVTGAVTLDGTLDVTLVDGCMPIPGQSFTLITGSSVAGTFPNFTPPATDCPVDWNIVINPGSVVLEVVTGTCNDADGDTFSDCCGTCAPAIGDQCADCDDADPLSFPGATELCDGSDNDCDTTVPSDEIDDDGDLYVECTGWNDTQGNAPTIFGGDDCDDTDAVSFPGATEVCDGNDNDCSSGVPDDEIDDDLDLYVECSGWDDTQGDQASILGGNDCDDADNASFPGATEVCDGNDNDCSAGVPDDEFDDDLDLYVECSGWSDTQGDQAAILGGADCDDTDANSFPGATELCDGNDNDCDTVVPIDEFDDDLDLYVECSGWNDTQGDQAAILGGADCDDTDATSFPGAAEVCDGNDNNCDTVVPIDEFDDDVDLYAECSGWNDTQGDQATILGGSDCDDTDSVSHPGATELCDGNDNDCDTIVPIDEADNDVDLYVECSGWSDTQGDQAAILGGADCDDTDSASYPGAAEVCDGNDNDCDTVVPIDEFDDDLDLRVECSGWNDTQGDQAAILGGADCDDTDANSFPGATELCDGNDNDCDTVVPIDEFDDDLDLRVECSGWNDTQGDQAAILGGADCDDTDSASYPGATEVCDGNDNDCDTVVPIDEFDDDLDLRVECSGWNDTQGDQTAILGGADCDDTDSASYPGAAEVCDGNDNDCDTIVPIDEADDDVDLYVECSGWNDTQGDQAAILGGADCDDTDSASYPGGAEVCDGNDNDCDTVVPIDEIDDDLDLRVECSGWNDTQGDQAAILGGADCDDTDSASYPGATEVCDGNDNDCDTIVPIDEFDDDLDLRVECSGWNDTQGDQAAILGGADCDDTDSASYPGAAEVCDGNDNDCDTIVPIDEADDDLDLYVECSGWSDTQGDQPSILGGDDCDDVDGISYPGAIEICDGNDNSCSGMPDDGDADSDGVLVCNDCDDSNLDVHAIPSETLNLLFLDSATMQWDPPASLGGTGVNYDVVRSGTADDFVALATCVESDDGTDSQAADASVPATGTVFFYLSRAENACGSGSAGSDSDAVERAAATCP